ncbi:MULTISPECIES: CBS domain-containing protein [unclassified Streptomyces]|uniref:CBS domain-containing protein n=1 Tax=Streptomyces TaxID=1883 RepID=UPI0013699516|nr:MULTISPECIES: CBS domain-containing protein [unclassified Streptomyces]NDZ97949.1 CBS domain-containing protein [Streptomyces sp. SID10116]MYY81520.1 CBS domain-containing protein [Streptomyces sp. SID335]MYZ18400.1 CBS domain-containing protein [Streptomyces sp. SID337]NDZ91661.1 CBS domain-containing protein [Streptomyces sp. SID10115]NEB45835.1 CBS domain-containing protein [Streptomyces sp. SID339]
MRHNKVGSVMTTDVIRATCDTSFKEVAQLLGDHHISGLPVVDGDEKVVGVISETDLLARQAATPIPFEPKHHVRLPPLTRNSRERAAKAKARTAGRLMSEPPVTVHADDTIVQAARTMARRRVERLPVLDEEERLVGIVTRRDLLQVFLRSDADIRDEVIEEVLVRSLWLSPRLVDVSVTEGVVTLTGRLERRSETEIAVSMTRQVDGVVAVVPHLTHRVDDSRLRPDEQALHGVTEDWLRKL